MGTREGLTRCGRLGRLEAWPPEAVQRRPAADHRVAAQPLRLAATTSAAGPIPPTSASPYPRRREVRLRVHVHRQHPAVAGAGASARWAITVVLPGPRLPLRSGGPG